MQITSKILTLSFLFLVTKAMAFEQIYYGDGIKDISVNSQEPTLLIFSSPPIARVCHPSGVLDFFPIENNDSEPTQTLNSVEWSHNSEKSDSDGTEKMLKLRPYQDSQTTLCDIKLANNETATIRFKTSSTIKRPSIELVNVFSPRPRKERTYDQNSLQIFQNLISGGELFDFYDITTSKDAPISKTSDLARYEVAYVGTDKEKYKVWIVKTVPTKKMAFNPTLQNVQLNQLYFSAWKLLSSNSKKDIWEPSNNLKLFILSSNDISTEELLEKLP